MPRRPGLPAVPSPPPTLPVLHRAADHPPGSVAAHLHAEQWTRVCRGVYVDRAPASLDVYAAQRHLALARIAAVQHRIGTPYVLSHTSAASMWGLPLLAPDPNVHVIHAWSAGTRMSRDLIRHTLPLPDDDVTVRGGHRVTTLERTAVDCALMLGPVGGLVVMDAALHRGADRDLCADLVARRAGSPGVRVARAVLGAADDGAESPGETRARLAIMRLGVVPPQTQVCVPTHAGVYWCDLGWEEWAVVAEYDGVAKYSSRGSASGEVLREKRREDAITETGRRMLRIIHEDVVRRGTLEPRLRRALPEKAFTLRLDPYLR